MALIRFRIDLPNGHSIGPGKIELLERLAERGSISAAARDMRISYRQAWLLLEALNSTFDKRVFETATGGSRGGGARLTPFGRRLIERYRALAATVEKAAHRHVGALARGRTARRSPVLRAGGKRRKPLKRHSLRSVRLSKRRP